MLKAELDFIILKEGLRARHARSHVYVKYKLSLFEVLKSLFIERRAETGGTVAREAREQCLHKHGCSARGLVNISSPIKTI